ncbi:uncharacterized protein [Anoplolepis gracilipes]|uniref:uncharacterized protein n=1 Tax=Anoplolepis gracilipes TaxID=354296 RepID=UPI003BA1B8DE
MSSEIRHLHITMRFAMYLAIVFTTLNFVNALPFPQFGDDGRERLAAKDTVYYGFPLFWYRRSFYDDSDDDIVNGAAVLNDNRKSSTVSYINVGAGWGR